MKRDVTITNPVLQGVFPDPSWMWHNNEAWLVTSSFGQVPGLPIHTSRDLSHWQRRCSAIDEEMARRLFLKYIRTDNHGIFAPTIREFGDAIIIVSTVMEVMVDKALADGADPDEINRLRAANGNFALVSRDDGLTWEGPHWIKGAVGNDPDFFIDADGTTWWTASRPSSSPRWPFQSDIWMRKLDTERWRLEGPERIIWHGAVEGATWAESPHIFLKDGTYYLLAAEAGTERRHAQSVARSDSLNACYYENNSRNPILTHRTLGEGFPVQNVGHSDMLRDDNGDWWGVCLGSRVVEGYSFMGREPFVFPIVWEDGWPVFTPGDALLRRRIIRGQENTRHGYQLGDIASQEGKNETDRDRHIEQINPNDYLMLPTQPQWIWTRVDDFDYEVLFNPTLMHEARIQQNRDVFASITTDSDSSSVVACISNKGTVQEIGRTALHHDEWYSVRLVGRSVRFAQVPAPNCIPNTEHPLLVGKGAAAVESVAAGGWPVINGGLDIPDSSFAYADAAFLSTESAGGYIGCLAGVR
ncbi:family 43 glycosylhydrolase [Bifidobacterium eulemuris]|uniref:Beta-xylosidase n=1 Tax=Bifidobacterium eulemuris TaxID=1765219 RepID=A0A261G3C4_9BIFI|nr:family 43 glycosylhydrolase [Bifidobacterium eulemuris]OZG65932.1 beta-xylosidase [Bifidobacterium eulemuris]QOL31998.1 family 43 glycosylhydrolase [Bifidobacterium eulemuris]